MQCILGEGGGTKTDWRILEEGQVIDSFQTQSYHPTNWNEAFFDEIATFWQGKLAAEYQIKAFLAGCFRKERREEFEASMLRREIRFSVSSDLHAAGIAAYGTKGSGWCIIAGTGSVLFHFNAGEVTEIRGGKGHEKGDEGSAYYFGKLVLEGRNIERFQPFVQIAISQYDEIAFRGKNKKLEVASLAVRLGDNPQFEHFHRKNIEQFVATHKLDDIQELCIIGSYAFHQQELFREVLLRKSVIACRFIAEPIMQLTECHGSIFE